MRDYFARVLRAYTRILNKHKYATQIATGGLLWFSGDILCQGLVHLRYPTPTSVDAEKGWMDWRRTCRMTLYGIGFSAPAYAFWYSTLERYAQRVFSAQAPGTSLALPTWLRARDSSPFLSTMISPLRRVLLADDGAARLRTWKMIGFKLAMDTVVFDPIYLALFFTVTSMMEGKDLREVACKLRADLAKTWLIDVAVWTPIQTANFRFVPVLYQALVVQSCNIGWNAYLSFVQHEHHHHRHNQ